MQSFINETFAAQEVLERLIESALKNGESLPMRRSQLKKSWNVSLNQP
jgi:predicted RNase H-like HicB family nuclease